MKKITFALVICILLMIGCETKNSEKRRLRQRVTEYYSHLNKGEFDMSWDFLMKYSKDKWNREGWTTFVQRFYIDIKPLEHLVMKISISKVKGHLIGKVVIKAKFENLKQKKIKSVEQEEEWAFEDGDWFKYMD